jgi:hypothetical protein
MDHLLSREPAPRGTIPHTRGHGHHHDSAVQVRQHLNLTNCRSLNVVVSALVQPGPVSREDVMSTRWMPWRCVPMKDGAPLRYAWGSRLQAVSPGSPNEATHRFGGTGLSPGGHPAN